MLWCGCLEHCEAHHTTPHHTTPHHTTPHHTTPHHSMHQQRAAAANGPHNVTLLHSHTPKTGHAQKRRMGQSYAPTKGRSCERARLSRRWVRVVRPASSSQPFCAETASPKCCAHARQVQPLAAESIGGLPPPALVCFGVVKLADRAAGGNLSRRDRTCMRQQLRLN